MTPGSPEVTLSSVTRPELLVLASALFAASCSSAPPSAPPPDLAVAEPCVVGDGGPAPTLAAIQATIFDPVCSGCHDASAAVDLTAGRAYGSLIGRAATTMERVDESCGGTLVVPGDPARSYLIAKLTQARPCAGEQMPRGEFGSEPLPDCQIDQIRRWILAGAPNQ